MSGTQPCARSADRATGSADGCGACALSSVISSKAMTCDMTCHIPDRRESAGEPRGYLAYG
eukprot:209290-Prymnesium_polylepis.1